MQISQETVQILKNFATINTNILIRPGQTLSTISAGKNIFARAGVSESFPREVAIYDLNSLLALLTLMDKQNIEFGDNSLSISKDNGRFEYFYSNPGVIVSAPDKSIEVDRHYEFSMSAEDISMLSKAAAITAAPHILVTATGGRVSMMLGDKKNDTANSYRKTIGETELEFDCHINVENFKVIPDSYDIAVSKKKFLHLRSKSRDLEYFIAMEPSSTI